VSTLADEMLLRVLVLGAAFVILFILPILLLWAGMKRKVRWCIAVGTTWLALSCGFVTFVADMFSARHERILDHGKTPDGREYVLFQACNGEPYAVWLYVRNTDSEWLFYYVDHEVWPWRHGGRLDFSDGKVRVFCGEEPFRTIDIEEESGSESGRYPSTMTAEEVFDSCRDK